MTLEEARVRIGKDTCFHWRDEDEKPQSLAGVVVVCDDPEWVQVDYGYAVRLSEVIIYGNPTECAQHELEMVR
jgi:hypothetical protein